MIKLYRCTNVGGWEIIFGGIRSVIPNQLTVEIGDHWPAPSKNYFPSPLVGATAIFGPYLGNVSFFVSRVPDSGFEVAHYDNTLSPIIQRTNIVTCALVPLPLGISLEHNTIHNHCHDTHYQDDKKKKRDQVWRRKGKGLRSCQPIRGNFNWARSTKNPRAKTESRPP